MPGHKRNPESAEEFLAGAYGIDLTEIDGFDNLHQAEGILKKKESRKGLPRFMERKNIFSCKWKHMRNIKRCFRRVRKRRKSSYGKELP